MQYFDLIQNSPEWYAARVGIPTGSSAHKIITPGGKLSEAADEYANQIIAELLTREPQDKFPANYWMERGSLMEDEAARMYEFISGEKLERGGFIVNDDFTFGVSPDRRVLRPDGSVKGIVEIKCPSPSEHAGNLIRVIRNSANKKYKPQTQSQLYAAEAPDGRGAEWNDFFSYHPTMPPALVRTERDEAYIEKLKEGVALFSRDINAKLLELFEKRIIPEIPIYKRPKPEAKPIWEEAA